MTDQAEALWRKAHALDLQFHAGDKSAGPKARATALKAAELERIATADRTRLELELRAASPMRGARAQSNELDTPLFGAASSPTLF